MYKLPRNILINFFLVLKIYAVYKIVLNILLENSFSKQLKVMQVNIYR